MAALKRFSIALALVAFALSSIPSAQAQFSFPVQPLGRITCVYSAVPNQVRSEGLAERTGDARLDCSNDGVYNPNDPQNNDMAQYVLANITVSLNTAVTNMLNVGGDGATVTDSVLIINDNNHFAPIDESLLAGSGGGACTASGGSDSIPDERYPCPHKGRLQGPNALSWDGVQFPVPGAPNDQFDLPDPNGNIPECVDIFDQDDHNSCFNVVTTIRVTNIRANAAAVGAGGAIFANLTIFSFAGISVTPSNQQTVANVFQGLTVDFGSPLAGLQCEEFHETFYLTLNEGFAGSFKTLGAPTFVQGDFAAENGYPVCENEGGGPLGGSCFDPQQNAGTGGGATQATRFLLRFFGIPDGIDIKVYDAVDEHGPGNFGDCEVDGADGDQQLCVERVAGADENGAGGSAVGGDDSTYEVGLDSDGNGYVVYELKDGDPFLTQDIDIPIIVWWKPDTGEDKPEIGSGQISATFGPLSDEGEAGNFPKPRFVDTGGDPFNFISVVRCSTTLLFPFVSNRFGFDTGFAISNTSMDWKGTDPQKGRCMIHYIGNTGDAPDSMPDDDISSIVQGGEQVTWTLSMGNPVWELNGAPDFQGFVIAMCEFQYAHGYAFITDATSAIPNFAQGYLALILQFGVDGRLINCAATDDHDPICSSEERAH